MQIRTSTIGHSMSNNNHVIPIVSEQSELCNDIAIMLLGKCNLDCDFCLNKVKESNYNKFIDQEFDPKVVLGYIQHLKQLKDNIVDKNDINLTLYGGELFQDKFDYNVYDQLLTAIEDIFKDCLDKLSIAIFSNFLFKDPQRVVNLLNKHCDKLDFNLTMSFDLVGRYTKPYMIPRVMDNFYYLTNNCQVKPQVTITGHRLNLESIMHKGLNFDSFEKLYNDAAVTITISNYINNPDVPQYAIDGEFLEKFWLFALENYPKISNVQGILHPIPREQSKGCHELILIGDTINRCCNNVGSYLAEYQNKFGCLYCEYYKNCNEICYFSQHSFDKCWRKSLFDKINE